MAWQNMARTMEMVAKLGDALGADWGAGAGWSVKGGGKKGFAAKHWEKDKGKGKSAGAKTRFCHWDTCTCAQKQTPQWDDSTACTGCKRPWSHHPPIERVVTWAYMDKLKSNQADPSAHQGKGKGVSKGKGKGKAADKAAPQDLTAERLAELRKERLAAIKAGPNAKLDAPPPQGQEAHPISDEMSKYLVMQPEDAPKGIQLEAKLLERAAGLTTTAMEMLKSLQGEMHPPSTPLETAGATCEKLLSNVASCASVEGKIAAERAHKGTLQCIITLEDAGADGDDADLRALKARATKQGKQVERLTEKAPSLKLRKLALTEALDAYQRHACSQVEFAEKGKAKAIERAKVRLELLEQIEATCSEMRLAALQSFQDSSDKHDQRAAGKAALVADVAEILTEKIEEVDNSMIVEVGDSDHESADAQEELTVTEAERDRLRLELDRLRTASAPPVTPGSPADELAKAKEEIAKLKTSLREASAKATQVPAGSDEDLAAPSEVVPLHDLWRDFNAEPNLLPPIQGMLPQDHETALTQLAGLFLAVPWGTALPAIQFSQLGVPPPLVHTLVGDVMWKDCWKERHGGIGESDWVPYKILNLLKYLTEIPKLDMKDQVIERGKDQYNAVQKEASGRRAKGSP